MSPRLPPIRSPTRRIPRTPCHKRGIAGRRREGWMTKQRCPYQRLRSTSQASMLTIAELIAVMRFTFDAFNTSTYSGRKHSIAECSDHPAVDIIQTAQTLCSFDYSSLCLSTWLRILVYSCLFIQGKFHDNTAISSNDLSSSQPAHATCYARITYQEGFSYLTPVFVLHPQTRRPYKTK